jgi:hypothetical protein
MLHFISWGGFFRFFIAGSGLYYLFIGIRYFPAEIRAFFRRGGKKPPALLLAIMAGIGTLHAQTADGNNGISQANTLIRSYFQTGTLLMYGIGALVGLVGAVRVFVLWNSGHRDEVNRAAAAWFGSCIFLVVVALIIQSFFGL